MEDSLYIMKNNIALELQETEKQIEAAAKGEDLGLLNFLKDQRRILVIKSQTLTDLIFFDEEEQRRK